MAGIDLAAELAAVERMNRAALQARWVALTGGPAPLVSVALLRLALAWERQAAVHGGLSRRVSQRLAQITGGRSRTADVRPGMRLVREWNGTVHVVTVGEDGAIVWNGAGYRSLSEVARAITGTRWSGPAFFGLKRKVEAAAA